MKRVTLIGDSIRMGYQQHVVTALQGRAEVWGPTTNGGDSSKVRTHLTEWMQEGAADIIHLNCGLHDLRKSFATGKAQIDTESYRANLCYIFDAVAATGVPLIWAATTPVNEAWHHERKGFDRLEADVAAYNAIALEEAQQRGIQVNDLHAVIENAGRDRLLSEDGVHFGDQGCTLLGDHVATCVQHCWGDE